MGRTRKESKGWNRIPKKTKGKKYKEVRYHMCRRCGQRFSTPKEVVYPRLCKKCLR